MSESSPSDLTVAFRSFPRRLHEALGALDPDRRAEAAPHERAVDAALGRAAAALGVAPPGTEPAAVAGAVAERIASIHPDRWDEGALSTLRHEAQAIGAAIRAIGDLAG